MKNLVDFVRESNMIEGIIREPTRDEMDAHKRILACGFISPSELIRFVEAVQPGAKIRDKKGMNVGVGRHIAPLGGPRIPLRLKSLLERMSTMLPHAVHLSYEHLHPFMDGNGRSGRALWLWMMNGDTSLGFLHRFYYQTLAANN